MLDYKICFNRQTGKELLKLQFLPPPKKEKGKKGFVSDSQKPHSIRTDALAVSR